jgi:hypothetical protein
MAMTPGRQFKEVYIRLEEETGFVCTVQYNRFLRKTKAFALQVKTEAVPDVEPEWSHVLRTRKRFDASSQGEA